MATTRASSRTCVCARSASARSTSRRPMTPEPPGSTGAAGAADLPEPPEPRLRRRPRSARPADSGEDNRAGGLLLVHAHPDDESFSRSEEHTSELQSLTNLVCRLLLEKKK